MAAEDEQADDVLRGDPDDFPVARRRSGAPRPPTYSGPETGLHPDDGLVLTAPYALTYTRS